MRGDFTRDTRERARRAGVRSVLLQQGRPIVDADWNEQAGITADRAEMLARHVIGMHGAPREDAGFAVSAAGDALTVGHGHLYTDGLALHNPAALAYASQLPATAFPALATVLANGQTAFVYVETLLRPTSAAVEPFLSDPALGGIEPVVREEADWAIRVVRMADTGVSAAQMVAAFATNSQLAIPQWRGTTGGLDADVQTEAETTDPGPCELPPTAGYLDQLNRLYRVEIHSPGAPGAATFKWTEDAGCEAGLRASGAGFAIDLPIERAGAWFPVNTVVEVIDDALERAGDSGPIGQITSAVGQPLVISGVPAAALSANVRIRRWATMPVAVPAGNAWTVLSKGIKIRFCAGHYARGSAWTIPGRTVLGDIMWPPYRTPDQIVSISGSNVGFFAPMEGRRRYAPLAIIRRSGGNLSVVHDLRDIFSPLNDQRAVDIRFDDSIAQLDASNVQDAIDALAVRDAACCTWHVLPGAGWESVFAEIAANQNGKICFAPGNYPISRPVRIAGKGHLKLVGAGPGTKIWCHGRAQALHFEDCASVEISDMSIAAEQNFIEPKPSGPATRITGVVDCTNCGPVRVERTVLLVNAPRAREAVCLRVEGGVTAGSGDVIVEDNDIVAGDLTSGVLILNGADVRITGNRIRPRSEDIGRTQARWFGDKRIAAILSRLAFSHGANEPMTRVLPVRRLSTALFRMTNHAHAGDQNSFFTAASVTAANWAAFAQDFSRLHANRSGPHWRWLMSRAVQRLWTNGGTVRGTTDFALFRNLFAAVSRAIAPTIEVGIIVAGSRNAPQGNGSRAATVTVSGNSLAGVATGIRIARSSGGGGAVRINAPSVWVTENRIVMRAVPLDMQRCGIQVANPERAWIQDNDILLETADPHADQARLTQVRNGNFHLIETDGVRVVGAIGLMFAVRGNSVRDCRTGVRVDAVAVPGRATTKQWLVADNMITGAREAFQLDGRCNNRDNLAG